MPGPAEQEPRSQEVIENMKKLISLLLAGVLVSSIVVTGCAKTEDAPADAPAAPAADAPK